MRQNRVVIDTTHCLVLFPHLTTQIKNAASETSSKPQVVFTHDSITVPPMTTSTITAFVDHPPEWNSTGIVTPVGKLTEAANLLISHSISTITDKETTVRVINTTDSTYAIMKHKDCRSLRSHSRVIQAHQAGGHANHLHDSGR